MLCCILRLLTKHIVNKNVGYKMSVAFLKNAVEYTEYSFEFVILYTRSKILIPPTLTCTHIYVSIENYYNTTVTSVLIL